MEGGRESVVLMNGHWSKEMMHGTLNGLCLQIQNQRRTIQVDIILRENSMNRSEWVKLFHREKQKGAFSPDALLHFIVQDRMSKTEWKADTENKFEKIPLRRDISTWHLVHILAKYQWEDTAPVDTRPSVHRRCAICKFLGAKGRTLMLKRKRNISPRNGYDI